MGRNERHVVPNPDGGWDVKLSIEFWWNGAAPQAFQVALAKGYTTHDTPYYEYAVGADASRNIRVCVDTTGTTFVPWDPGIAWPANGTWHQIVVSYDGSLAANNLKLYVDKTLEAQANRTGTVRSYPTPLGLMDILNRGAGWNTTGKIDDVAIYGAALTAARVAAHYDVSKAAPSPGAGNDAMQTDPNIGASLPAYKNAMVNAANASGEVVAPETSADSEPVTAPDPTESGIVDASQANGTVPYPASMITPTNMWYADDASGATTLVAGAAGQDVLLPVTQRQGILVYYVQDYSTGAQTIATYTTPNNDRTDDDFVSVRFSRFLPDGWRCVRYVRYFNTNATDAPVTVARISRS